MRENRRAPRARFASRALFGLVGLVGLGSLVVASATSLGGVAPDDLGGAAGDAQRLDGVTLDWSPVWHDGAWHLADLTLAADEPRGFLTGDRVRVTLAGADDCEITTTASAPSATLVLASDDLEQACGALPSLASADGVAVAVVGVDDITGVSDLGELTGSVAGFASDAVAVAGSATASTSAAGVVGTVVVDLTGLTAGDLDGASAVVAVSVAGAPVGSTETSELQVAALETGVRVTLDVSQQSWTATGTSAVDVAISTPQHLVSGVSDAAALVLASGVVTIPTTGGGETGGGETGGGGNEPGGTHGTDGLEPVFVSDGITYRYTTPWTGAQTNLLTFCHQFTVTNTTGAALQDWTVQFDTTLAPMWGMNPTAAGTVSLSNIETRDYVAGTGYWTVGGSSAWARQIEAGGSRTVQFCATSVPTPTPDPDLYEVSVSVVAQSDWYVTFAVKVTSDSPYYVPWQVEVDFADLVCGSSIAGHPLSFQQVLATPVAGSGTAFVIQGAAGNTQLVSATQSRSFTFASYSPGPGWKLPCGG